MLECFGLCSCSGIWGVHVYAMLTLLLNTSSMVFKCKDCDKTFINERGLLIHTSRMHENSDKK